MRVSIRDVARRAGVSHVTVANVLNGRQHRTSAETYEHVLKTAREMNYIPVAQPSSQRRHIETRIIGLVYDHGDWEDYWGLQTYKGLRHAATEHGYDLLTILRQPPEGLSKNEVRFLDRRSDGLIFIVPENRTATFETLLQHEIPVVSCYISDVPPGVASVVVDNRGAMKLVVQHLLELGHRDFLFVSISLPRADFDQRYKGYVEAVQAAGLEAHALLVDNYGETEATWKARAVAEVKRLGATAVIGASDWFAVHMQRALWEAGLRVPQDISIFGMDDESEAAALGISSIRFSCIDVGIVALESMLKLIGGENAENCSHTLPVEVVLRSSVGPPAQTRLRF